MTRRRTVLKSIIRDQRHKMFWRRNIFSRYFIFFFQKSDTRGVSTCCHLITELKIIMISIGIRTVSDPSRRTIREDQKDTCTCIKSSRNYCQRRSTSNKSIWLLYGSEGLQIGHRSSDMKGLHYQWWSWRQKRLWKWKDERFVQAPKFMTPLIRLSKMIVRRICTRRIPDAMCLHIVTTSELINFNSFNILEETISIVAKISNMTIVSVSFQISDVRRVDEDLEAHSSVISPIGDQEAMGPNIVRSFTKRSLTDARVL